MDLVHKDMKEKGKHRGLCQKRENKGTMDNRPYPIFVLKEIENNSDCVEKKKYRKDNGDRVQKIFGCVQKEIQMREWSLCNFFFLKKLGGLKRNRQNINEVSLTFYQDIH